MAKFILYTICGLVTVAFVLGIYWIVWLLWCWVLGYFWSNGPVNIVSPEYWPFVGMLFLVNILGTVIFKSNKNA